MLRSRMWHWRFHVASENGRTVWLLSAVQPPCCNRSTQIHHTIVIVFDITLHCASTYRCKLKPEWCTTIVLNAFGTYSLSYLILGVQIAYTKSTAGLYLTVSVHCDVVSSFTRRVCVCVYIYIYIYVCVCVCVCKGEREVLPIRSKKAYTRERR